MAPPPLSLHCLPTHLCLLLRIVGGGGAKLDERLSLPGAGKLVHLPPFQGRVHRGSQPYWGVGVQGGRVFVCEMGEPGQMGLGEARFDDSQQDHSEVAAADLLC